MLQRASLQMKILRTCQGERTAAQPEVGLSGVLMTIAEGRPKAQSGFATTAGNPRRRRRIFELARTRPVALFMWSLFKYEVANVETKPAYYGRAEEADLGSAHNRASQVLYGCIR